MLKRNNPTRVNAHSRAYSRAYDAREKCSKNVQEYKNDITNHNNHDANMRSMPHLTTNVRSNERCANDIVQHTYANVLVFICIEAYTSYVTIN